MKDCIEQTEKITKYFYLLDPSDKIQGLKYISEVIKTKTDKDKCKITTNDLYLLETEDITEE